MGRDVTSNLKSIETSEKFKTEVKKWIPSNCNCRICKEYVAGVGFVNVVGKREGEGNEDR